MEFSAVVGASRSLSAPQDAFESPASASSATSARWILGYLAGSPAGGKGRCGSGGSRRPGPGEVPIWVDAAGLSGPRRGAHRAAARLVGPFFLRQGALAIRSAEPI